jgi:hypothetical protein
MSLHMPHKTSRYTERSSLLLQTWHVTCSNRQNEIMRDNGKLHSKSSGKVEHPMKTTISQPRRHKEIHEDGVGKSR